MTRTTVMQRESIVERCIENCQDCHGICVETIAYCLRLGAKHAGPKHITLMQDCADICKMSEDGMLRNSNFMRRICRLCADICISCAESCEMFPNDEAMIACAQKCRECADICRQMSMVSEETGTRLTSFS
ncbi:MAG: four-helix bundle copper-binding protein [Euryarchaeota archaeon]|nr:four-helix bundle copper-binding protein [Euryarchaeota archaeon]